MSHYPSTFRLVEEALVARLVALDASAFTDGRRTPSEWHESKTLLGAIGDSSALGHLAFNVWISSAPNDGASRGQTFQDNDEDNDVELDARVKVVFLFKIRPTQQTADGRLATDAARDVIRAIMAPWSATDEATFGTVTMLLVDGLQVSMTPDGSWVMVTQDYSATFDFDLLPG